jgi:asparagine synthase (glutamine-hydrolysing)
MFAFATEAEALLALPGVDASLDESRIADSFVGILESMDETSAPYRSIERFPPATWMRMEAGRVHRQRYWSPVERGPAGLPASEAGWIEGLRAHLLEAVRCRMRADVPVGSMLSGGLDSSVVVAIASREAQAGGQGPFPTFSAVSAEPGCAETAAIALACATLPIAPTRFDARDERGELQRIVREWPQMGQPFDHCMAMQDALYAAAARRGVRVLMDGIDADSLFDEAGLLDDLLRSGRWRQLRRELRGYRDFYGGDARAWHLLRPILSGRIVPEWLRAGLRPMRARRQVAAQVADTLIAPDFARRVGFEERYARRSRNPVRSSAWADGLHGQSAVGLGTTTAAVERYNRVASRHAVEPRHPFLDRRLVEYCAWMPLELRQRDGWPKWALREAMAGRLHRDLAWRRGKEHLGPYVNQALFSQIASGDASLETLSAEVRPFVDAAKIAKLPPLGRPEAYGEWGWEPRLFVAALQAWLRPRRGGAGKPA